MFTAQSSLLEHFQKVASDTGLDSVAAAQFVINELNAFLENGKKYQLKKLVDHDTKTNTKTEIEIAEGYTVATETLYLLWLNLIADLADIKSHPYFSKELALTLLNKISDQTDSIFSWSNLSTAYRGLLGVANTQVVRDACTQKIQTMTSVRSLDISYFESFLRNAIKEKQKLSEKRRDSLQWLINILDQCFVLGGRNLYVEQKQMVLANVIFDCASRKISISLMQGELIRLFGILTEDEQRTFSYFNLIQFYCDMYRNNHDVEIRKKCIEKIIELVDYISDAEFLEIVDELFNFKNYDLALRLLKQLHLLKNRTDLQIDLCEALIYFDKLATVSGLIIEVFDSIPVDNKFTKLSRQLSIKLAAQHIKINCIDTLNQKSYVTLASLLVAIIEGNDFTEEEQRWAQIAYVKLALVWKDLNRLPLKDVDKNVEKYLTEIVKINPNYYLDLLECYVQSASNYYKINSLQIVKFLNVLDNMLDYLMTVNEVRRYYQDLQNLYNQVKASSAAIVRLKPFIGKIQQKLYAFNFIGEVYYNFSEGDFDVNDPYALDWLKAFFVGITLLPAEQITTLLIKKFSWSNNQCLDKYFVSIQPFMVSALGKFIANVERNDRRFFWKLIELCLLLLKRSQYSIKFIGVSLKLLQQAANEFVANYDDVSFQLFRQTAFDALEAVVKIFCRLDEAKARESVAITLNILVTRYASNKSQVTLDYINQLICLPETLLLNRQLSHILSLWDGLVDIPAATVKNNCLEKIYSLKDSLSRENILQVFDRVISWIVDVKFYQQLTTVSQGILWYVFEAVIKIDRSRIESSFKRFLEVRNAENLLMLNEDGQRLWLKHLETLLIYAREFSADLFSQMVNNYYLLKFICFEMLPDEPSIISEVTTYIIARLCKQSESYRAKYKYLNVLVNGLNYDGAKLSRKVSQFLGEEYKDKIPKTSSVYLDVHAVYKNIEAKFPDSKNNHLIAWADFLQRVVLQLLSKDELFNTRVILDQLKILEHAVEELLTLFSKIEGTSDEKIKNIKFSFMLQLHFCLQQAFGITVIEPSYRFRPPWGMVCLSLFLECFKVPVEKYVPHFSHDTVNSLKEFFDLKLELFGWLEINIADGTFVLKNGQEERIADCKKQFFDEMSSLSASELATCLLSEKWHKFLSDNMPLTTGFFRDRQTLVNHLGQSSENLKAVSQDARMLLVKIFNVASLPSSTPRELFCLWQTNDCLPYVDAENIKAVLVAIIKSLNGLRWCYENVLDKVNTNETILVPNRPFYKIIIRIVHNISELVCSPTQDWSSRSDRLELWEKVFLYSDDDSSWVKPLTGFVAFCIAEHWDLLGFARFTAKSEKAQWFKYAVLNGEDAAIEDFINSYANRPGEIIATLFKAALENDNECFVEALFAEVGKYTTSEQRTYTGLSIDFEKEFLVAAATRNINNLMDLYYLNKNLYQQMTSAIRLWRVNQSFQAARLEILSVISTASINAENRSALAKSRSNPIAWYQRLSLLLSPQESSSYESQRLLTKDELITVKNKFLEIVSRYDFGSPEAKSIWLEWLERCFLCNDSFMVFIHLIEKNYTDRGGKCREELFEAFKQALAKSPEDIYSPQTPTDNSMKLEEDKSKAVASPASLVTANSSVFSNPGKQEVEKPEEKIQSSKSITPLFFPSK